MLTGFRPVLPGSAYLNKAQNTRFKATQPNEPTRLLPRDILAAIDFATFGNAIKSDAMARTLVELNPTIEKAAQALYKAYPNSTPASAASFISMGMVELMAATEQSVLSQRKQEFAPYDVQPHLVRAVYARHLALRLDTREQLVDGLKPMLPIQVIEDAFTQVQVDNVKRAALLATFVEAEPLVAAVAPGIIAASKEAVETGTRRVPHDEASLRFEIFAALADYLLSDNESVRQRGFKNVQRLQLEPSALAEMFQQHLDAANGKP